jgi:hypothetical protein
MNSCPNNYYCCAYNDDGGGDNHDRWVYVVVSMVTILVTGMAEVVVLINLSFGRYLLLLNIPVLHSSFHINYIM